MDILLRSSCLPERDNRSTADAFHVKVTNWTALESEQELCGTTEFLSYEFEELGRNTPVRMEKLPDLQEMLLFVESKCETDPPIVVEAGATGQIETVQACPAAKGVIRDAQVTWLCPCVRHPFW
jgi:hypothetical protein